MSLMEANVAPPPRGSRLDADHPENGVLIPCRFTLNPLAGARNELVLFDVNRRSVSSTVMIADPGPLTARLMASPALPFALTLLANESPDSAAVVVRRKESLSARASSQLLERFQGEWNRCEGFLRGGLCNS